MTPGCEYVLSVGPTAKVFAPETMFAVPERKRPGRGRAPERRGLTASPRRSAS